MSTTSFLPPLSPADEIEYFRRYHAGEEEARTVLIRANILFVKRIALEYAARRANQAELTLEELISEGQIGLLEAIERFDETRGFKFITYAVWWIRQAILKALAEHISVVRIPLSRVQAARQEKSEEDRLLQLREYQPTPRELAEALDLDGTEDLTNLGGDVSLDTPRYAFSEDDGGPTQGDRLIDGSEDAHAIIEADTQTSLVRQLLARTSDTVDRRIITWYFGLDGEESLTLEEIGARLKLTRERIRQRRDRALSRMRAQVDGWNLAKSEVLPE